MDQERQRLEEETRTVRRNFNILNIVNDAKSAEEVKRILEDQEFPTSILREARLLFRMKKDFPEAFEEVKNNLSFPINPPDRTLRIFSINYRFVHNPHVTDLLGSCVIKPHFGLPPIFWDYNFFDEDGELIFSIKEGLGEKYKNKDLGSLEFTFSCGSKSIPASLRICFEEDLDGFKVEFIRDVKSSDGTYRGHNTTFVWVRHIITEGLKIREEWYERRTMNSERGENSNRVLFRKLGEDEAKSFDREVGWVLILETKIYVSLGKKAIRFYLTTFYEILGYLEWQESNEKRSFRLSRLDRVKLPYSNPGTVHYNFCPFVSSSGLCEVGELRNSYSRFENIENAISQISERTPSVIDGIKVLWNFFGFKNTKEDRIYNSMTTEQLEANKSISAVSDVLPL